MNYEDFEASIAQGQPIRLYLFQRSEKVYWGYTNADRDIIFEGFVYKSEAISDDGFRQTGEVMNDMLKLTVPINNSVANMFKVNPPSEEIMLRVREVDWKDLESSLVVWVGSVSNVSISEADRAEMHCQSLEASLGRDGLKRTYNRSCDYAVYSKDCGLDKSQFALSATIDAMDGASITCTLHSTPKASLNYGFIEWNSKDDSSIESRGIDEVIQVGAAVKLVIIGGSIGLQLGQKITIYPGCNQTSEACEVTFDNLLNFGGFRHIPGKSPFDGSPIV